jgi:hypothetical protein
MRRHFEAHSQPNVTLDAAVDSTAETACWREFQSKKRMVE